MTFIWAGRGSSMATMPANTSAWPMRIIVGSSNLMVMKPLRKRPAVTPMRNRLAQLAAVSLSMPQPSTM